MVVYGGDGGEVTGMCVVGLLSVYLRVCLCVCCVYEADC